jgi:hypothetical protein
MRTFALFTVLLTAAGSCLGGVDILSVTPCSIEMTWQPVRIAAVKVTESGGIRIALERGVPFDLETWMVEMDRDGYLQECYDMSPAGPAGYGAALDDGTGLMILTAATRDGDVLWSCPLEGTDDFSNYQQITELPGGDVLVNSPPDCNSIYTEIQLISSAGDMLWHLSLGTDYLLGLDEPVGETSADVAGMAATASGDILLCGGVAQFYTSPTRWFVCLLDGDTGQPMWVTTGEGLGEASLLGVTEASDGSIVGVGQTAPAEVREGMVCPVWGARQALAVMLDGSGSLSGSVTEDPGSIASWQAVAGYDSGRDYAYDSAVPPLEFLVAGVDTVYNELAVLRLEVSRQ